MGTCKRCTGRRVERHFYTSSAADELLTYYTSLGNKMKFRIIIMIASIIGLAGCGSISRTEFKLTDTEKQEIKDGKLIKPHVLLTIDSKTINVTKSGKIFICAKPDFKINACYPNLGERVAAYFEKRGIHTTQNRQEATNTITLMIAFGYSPYPTTEVMQTADAALGEDNTFDHIKLMTDEEIANMRKDTNISTGIGAVAAALLMGATGQHAAYAALSNTQNTHAGISESQEIKVTLHDDGNINPLRLVELYYEGPAAPARTFPVLFDEAMKEAASKVVQN